MISSSILPPPAPNFQFIFFILALTEAKCTNRVLYNLISFFNKYQIEQKKTSLTLRLMFSDHLVHLNCLLYLEYAIISYSLQDTIELNDGFFPNIDSNKSKLITARYEFYSVYWSIVMTVFFMWWLQSHTSNFN